MNVKASLHLHTKEDFRDGKKIKYDIFELIDQADKAQFSVLALTGHEKMVCRAEHIAYAKERGILLIAGVELEIKGKHILVLNCDIGAEAIKDFSTLETYRQTHPDCFVIVAHPNHRHKSLGLAKLKKYRHLFDAVEHSWYYLKSFDPNLPVKQIAKQLGLPFIATADLHLMEYFEGDYALLEIDELTIPKVFEAIRQGKFENVSQPKTLTNVVIFFWRMIFGY